MTEIVPLEQWRGEPNSVVLSENGLTVLDDFGACPVKATMTRGRATGWSSLFWRGTREVAVNYFGITDNEGRLMFGLDFMPRVYPGDSVTFAPGGIRFFITLETGSWIDDDRERAGGGGASRRAAGSHRAHGRDRLRHEHRRRRPDRRRGRSGVPSACGVVVSARD